tara:strand:+ start:3643 stop:4482 length:840 start_codon:yes stop_codon:yes gene_type:complete
MDLQSVYREIDSNKPTANIDTQETIGEKVRNLACVLKKYMVKASVKTLNVAYENIVDNIPSCASRPPIQHCVTDIEHCVVMRIAVWRIAQRWYGPLSPSTLNISEKIHAAFLQLDPSTFDSPILALCYAYACNAENKGEIISDSFRTRGIPGRAKLFAPPKMRTYLTTSSPLLDDFVFVYSMLAIINDPGLFKMATARVKNNSCFCEYLVYKSGDIMLEVIDEEVYDTSPQDYRMMSARRMFYSTSTLTASLKFVKVQNRTNCYRDVRLVDESAWLTMC